jgi:hypothetical protein
MQIKIYKNQYGYSTLCKNGEDKMYLSVQFKKGNEPKEDKATIKINDGFFSMYKNKVGIAFPKLVILNYEVVDNYEKEEREAIQNENNYTLNTDELPF